MNQDKLKLMQVEESRYRDQHLANLRRRQQEWQEHIRNARAELEKP